MRNLQQMMSQVKKMQEDMQQQLEALRVEASSGGGMVTVTMNGNKRLLAIKIDPEVLKSADIEMLQDLIQAAFNEAIRKVDDALAAKLGGLTSGLNIPGLNL
jgi:DNA-binding YbaB/EbfC family protein